MHPADESTVRVTVVRTGGIAGLRRRWEACPDGEAAREWASLIDRCPWDDPPSDPSGADRFCWRVSAEAGPRRREAELPDADVQGPWRALIDAVRAWPAVSSDGSGRTGPVS
ncbi:protealysin inhibitor emfourin [Microbacterium pullorum]|uniref:protealysin inhibitor emfourin n=1 Tax=Microbacterium pullorum TaxID=2762236 RepID=UPI00296B3EB3|nr:protealysin inhibitor emfourin [Microbacterium pullorum]